MSGWELRVNVYDGSKIGHANVSFYQDGEHQYTLGANIRLEVPQLALPQILPFEPDDGIYRDESAYHLAAITEGTVTSASVPVTGIRYGELLAKARGLENETFNYSVFTEACVELVQDFYQATGHPGAFGDLFSSDQRGNSLVWTEVPVSDRSPFSTWPDDTPFYAPPDPIMPGPPMVPAPTIFAPMPDPPTPGRFDASLAPDEVEDLLHEQAIDRTPSNTFAMPSFTPFDLEADTLAFSDLNETNALSTEDVDEWIETVSAPVATEFEGKSQDEVPRDETLSFGSLSLSSEAETEFGFETSKTNTAGSSEPDFGEPADEFDFIDAPDQTKSSGSLDYEGIDLMEALSLSTSDLSAPSVDASEFQTEETDYGSIYGDDFLFL